MSRRALAAILLLMLAIPAAACRRAGKPSESAPAAAKRYPISGVIRELDAGKPEITLEHGPIEGFMDAMTMPFPVRAEAALLSRLHAGDRIAGTLVVDGDRFWLEGIALEPPLPPPPPTEPSAGAPPASATTPRPNRGVALGDPMPDFALTDQTGRAVRLTQLRGQPIAVTFLYTRCPIATACPMTTAKFSRLDAMLAAKRWGQLLTITVDPEHDTPEVLSDYAKKAGADPNRWKLLTGEPKAVAEVAERFGVLYYPDKGQIVHSQAVAVLDARGRLSNIYYGENWQPEDILRDMEKARKG
ncbi:MAG: SCO family protein [Thermoanaerobaculia bacterium]